MRKAKTNLAILFIALISLISVSSCTQNEDYKLIEDMIRYMEDDKIGDEDFINVYIFDEYVQKSISINFANVDTVQEADGIIRSMNQFLADRPEYFLHDDYYIEVNMDAGEYSYSRNFTCSNSMKYYKTGDEGYRDTVVPIEKNLCHLRVNGIVLDTPSRKISSFNGLFSDIKRLRLSDSVSIDDLSVFGTFHNLQSVSMDIAGVGVSDDTLTQLREMYPEIIFN